MTDELLIKYFAEGGETAWKAWRYFLDNYSNLIIKVIRTHTNDYDEIMDKYLFVCSKLSSNSFRLLLKYDINNDYGAKFSTWLKVIVSNLSIDEYRMKHGRKRYPKAIEQMGRRTREVFKLYYWKGFDINQISVLLRCGKSEVMVILENIKEFLSGHIERENINPDILSLHSENIPAGNDLVEETDAKEITNLLSKWIASLETKERLIIKLKYWNAWSAKEIAEFVGLSERKVYAFLEKTLSILRNQAKASDSM